MFPEIKTPNFTLRQFTTQDLENVFRGLSDERVIKYYGISYNTMEETKLQLGWFAELEKNKTGVWWAICSENVQTFYGAIGFNNLNSDFKNAEIGFWILPDHWRKGILNEVLPMVCTFGFENLNLHRIVAEVETENKACIGLMKKFNFIHEGTKRDCEIKDGKFISLHIFSKLKSDNKHNTI